jgi:hypothetical protein
MSLIYFILRPLSTSRHASFVVDGARDATQEGIATASVAGKAGVRPKLENSQDPKRTRTVQEFLQRKFIIEPHFAGRKSLM